MIDVIASILILYLLYKLIFDFIVPVSKTTARFKNQVNEMHNRQEEQLRKQQNGETRSKAASKEPNTTTTDGEYIDFEDVR